MAGPFKSANAMQYVISYDLGTGGLKAGLFNTCGEPAGFEFLPYETFYPCPGYHEQRPRDWWQAICSATKSLIKKHQINPTNIVALASSGQSLVAAPIDRNGDLLLESVPIWSDRRASEEAKTFFEHVDYQTWYMTTGNGDPPETYSVFKLMWLKRHLPEIFSRTRAFLGSKDYINFRLTGKIFTDYSYASGSGAFELKNWRYSETILETAGLSRDLLPQVVESHAVIGSVTAEAARECGLCAGTRVVCGGVDNSCMALGTTGISKGSLYTSLGSSAWMAISADKPVLDAIKLPFVFAHIEKGYYTSAVSIFSAARAFQWARDIFCPDLAGERYAQMDLLAAASPVGANGVMFYPALAGGSSQEPSEYLQGAFNGLTLSTNRGDILRAILEGVALSLGCFCLPVIEPFSKPEHEMIICGGGAKSDLWMQIFADVFGRTILRINVDQDAASLGAAAIALRGAGYWHDYIPLDGLFQVEKTFHPIPVHFDKYAALARNFSRWVEAVAISNEFMQAGNNIEKEK